MALALACDGPIATLYVEDAASFLDDVEAGASIALDGGDRGGRGEPDTAPDVELDGRSDQGSDEPTDAGVDLPADPGRTDLPVRPEDTGDLEPACVEYPASLDFGARIVGRDHQEVLQVRNCGGFEAQNLVIESMIFVNDAVVTSAPEFSFIDSPDFPFSMGPNQTWAFNIGYLPTLEGEHTAVIRMQTNAPGGELLDVMVTGSAL